MEITDDIMTGAAIAQDAAGDIIFIAECAMANRGVTEASEVIVALLAAAWAQHKRIAGGNKHGAFSSLLRDMADAVDRTAKLN